MCLPCKSKNMKVWSFMQNRMTGYPIKFDQNQVQQLKKKFRKISGNRQIIDKASFQENMGILGYSSLEGFSDRLFNSFDTDTDGKISFQDFVQYMQVLRSGSQRNKAKISYRLIDIKNKNSIYVKEFKQFLEDYFRSWTSITNSIVTPQVKQRTDYYVERLYNKVKKQTGKDFIDFGYYAEKVFNDQQYLESFEYITEGVANMFISGSKVGEDQLILYKVIKSIRKINNALDNTLDRQSTSQHGQYDRFSTNNSVFNSKSERLKPTSILKQQVPQITVFEPKSNLNNKFFSKLGVTNNTTLMNDTLKNSFSQNNNTTHQTYANNTTYLQPPVDQKNGKSSTHQLKQFQYRQSYHTQAPHFQQSCKNCIRVEVLEKKIQFLTSKIKKLVQETQRVYERLDQKLFDKTSAKKNQTVGNIHVTQNRTAIEGDMIFFGDDNWNLVLNMMIGIQMAVRSVRGYQQMIYEEPKDFDLKYYFQLVPRRFGDQNYLSRICSFTDYAPNTFNHIRKLFNIDNQQYINSIGPNKLMTSLMMGEVTSLTGLTSQGKSGSFFYYTADGKYMLKTIHYRQYKHLRKILQDYYFYLKQNPNTLITKFFGLHKLIQKDGQGEVIGKSYFVIMGNVFNTQEKITERYDIKGSSYGRQTRSSHPNATKKDNDFKKDRQPISIDPQYRQQLLRIIRKDAQFFRQHEIIDYSLLIGVIKKNPTVITPHISHKQREKIRNSPQKFKSRQSLQFEISNQLRQSHRYENLSQTEDYIFGIIDILTQYNTKKAMEYFFKSTIYGNGVSAVPPDDYAARFINFIDNVIFKKCDDIQKIERIPVEKQQVDNRQEEMIRLKNKGQQKYFQENRNKLMIQSRDNFARDNNHIKLRDKGSDK